jgi:hypothetical protein
LSFKGLLPEDQILSLTKANNGRRTTDHGRFYFQTLSYQRISC